MIVPEYNDITFVKLVKGKWYKSKMNDISLYKNVQIDFLHGLGLCFSMIEREEK